MESLLALSFDRLALGGLCRRYGIRRLAVFGSALRGELGRESDLVTAGFLSLHFRPRVVWEAVPLYEAA